MIKRDEKKLKVEASNLAQDKPDVLTELWRAESYGNLNSHYRLYAMLPPHIKEATEEMRSIVYRNVGKLERELNAFFNSSSPAFAERKAEWLKEAADLFEKAEFGTVAFEEIPNEYCNEGCCPPWLLVATTIGILKVGWRKRVMVLDWSKSIVLTQSYTLFKDEDVTKDGRSIHCWGYDKAMEYLVALRKELPEQTKRQKKDRELNQQRAAVSRAFDESPGLANATEEDKQKALAKLEEE